MKLGMTAGHAAKDFEFVCGYDGDLSIEPHSATWKGRLGEAGVLFPRDFVCGYMPGDRQ